MTVAAILAIILALSGLQLPVAVATAVIGGQSIGAVLGGLTIAEDLSLAGTAFDVGKKVVKFDIALYRVLKDPRVQAALRQRGVQIRLMMAVNGEAAIRLEEANCVHHGGC